MNNYPSSNFSTVFFLVIVFIGMGLLLYHSYEITMENNQLTKIEESLESRVDSLDSTNSELGTENESLVNENFVLRSDNNTLYDTNSQLKTDLEKATTELNSLRNVEGDELAELETLRTQNNVLRQEILRLSTLPDNRKGKAYVSDDLLYSAFLPTDIDWWKKFALVVVFVTIILVSYSIYYLLIDKARDKTKSITGISTKIVIPRKGRAPQIIDSSFINR